MKTSLVFACFALGMSVLALPPEAGQASAKEALQELNELIGNWKGSGTSERNKTEIWKEAANCGWLFKGGDSWMVVEVPTSKFFKNGELRFLVEKKHYQLTLTGKDVVRLVLGARWAESGKIFMLFGPGIGVMLLYNCYSWIHLSLGKPGRWLRWTFIEAGVTALLFVVALPWGPAGIAAAWSLSYWILLIPAFWYAGLPFGFGVSCLTAAIWRYAAASLVAGSAPAAIIRGTPLWGAPSGTNAALGATIIISALFVTLYLGTVILLHRGLEPLQQLATLLRELAPTRAATIRTAEPVGRHK